MSTERLDRRLVSLMAPASMEAEQYQSLRLKLEHLKHERDLRVIAISSPGAMDGKTLTAINLAGALARGSNARILLIEAVLRRPAVSRYLGLDPRKKAGLSQMVLEPERTLQDAVQQLAGFTFDVILAGESDTPVPEMF